MKVRAVLTDIEGTTSSISFVHDVLFPYASRELPAFVRARQDSAEVAKILDSARSEAGEADAGTERLIEILLAWIAEDKKATPLKELQGHIWKRGYESGDFTGHVFDDAVRCMRAWSRQGIALYVYSSGSVSAQRLLFGHSDFGDLTDLFTGYFDTTTGHKRDSRSYEKISRQIGLPAGEVLFLSDVVEELEAAALAGMQTIQLVRDDDVIPGSHKIARDFHDISLEDL